MPEIILNTAGTCRTTGTADPVIIASTGRAGSFADIADGTEVCYFRRYAAAGRVGFENAVGIWRPVVTASGIGYIDRTSIDASSNDGAAVVWGVGLQVIDVSIKPDMLVLADDPRLDTVEPGDLGTAATIDGSETWIASQDGEGIDLTAEQVSGTPFTQKSGHGAIKRIREYTDFSRIRPAFASSTGGTLDLEPYLVTQSGTGASASQATVTTLFDPGVSLNTGTTNTGYVVLQHLFGPIAYLSGTSSFDTRAEIKLVDLATAGEDYVFSFGFFVLGATPATTQFIGLIASRSLGSNWAQMVKNAAGQTTPGSTGVALQTSANTTLRAWYDYATAKTRFYIDGTEAPSIIDAARTMDPFSLVRAGFILQKIAGTTNRTVHIHRHSIDILWRTVPHF